MRIIACQYDILWENRQGNLDKVNDLLSGESIPEGSLILLPEMFSSGFTMNVDRVKENDPSEAEACMSELAQRYQSCVVGGLVFKHDCGKGLNTLSAFEPTGLKIGNYQKNHCFSYTLESEHYLSGEDILVFELQGFQVCPTICYDLRFPELYRRGVKAGANLFPIIASWPKDRIDHWDSLLKARAIENQAIVIGVNRVGEDPKWKYPGHTQIIDHQGAILASNSEEECCVMADVSVEPLQQWREQFRALDDMKGKKFSPLPSI
jgi:predicted amidohydrolase